MMKIILNIFILLMPLVYCFCEETKSNEIIIPVILDPLESVEIYPQLFEEIEEIPFHLGQSFKKGDLLLRMRNQFYKTQLEKTKVALEFAEEDLKIKESLFKDKLISNLDMIQARMNLATAESNLAETARLYNQSFVLAPFDGKIGSIQVRKYERPIPQKSMMSIFNARTIIAKFLISAHLLSQFQIDQTIPITIVDLNQTIPAKLIRIGREINPVSLKVHMEAEIDNFDGAIIPGMASFIRLEDSTREEINL